VPAARDVSGAARPKRVTLRDVAARAGVSLSTASLVFSGRGPVAASTADRVRAAAEQLSYAGPDPLASSLRQGRAGTVAVVVEGRLGDAFADPFARSVMDGLAGELDAIPAGMLLLARVPGDDARLLGQLAVAACDGVVFPLSGPRTDPAVDLIVGRGIPIVGAGSPVDPRVPQIRVDERGASAAMTRHLTTLGHRNIGHVTMPLTPGAMTSVATAADVADAVYGDARGRALGVLDVAPAARVVQAASLEIAAGMTAARLLLDTAPDARPTAVVAQSDLLAAGVIRAAGELGIRVPEDLSVTGFDGLDLPWLDYDLTTVVQDGRAKGRALGELIARAMAGQSVSSQAFPTQLRVGTTTAVARP
jgi:DNA-binding LacI/PurR family transcriptional regulator